MHWFFDRLSRFFAILGGIVLTVLIVMVCLSILGRSMNSVLNGDFMQAMVPAFADALLAAGIGPINGDFELVEAGMAFAVFAFLPICHLNGSHATVDIFTSKLSHRKNRLLRMITEVVFALVLVIIAYQLFLGTLSKQTTGETTFLLQFPLWWAYTASLLAAVVTAVVAVYTAVVRTLEFATDENRMPDQTGTEH